MLKKILFSNLLFFAVLFVTADALFGIVPAKTQSFTVPDFCGGTETELFSDSRFSVTAEYCYDESPAGTVLSQDPAPGSIRKLRAGGSPLRVTVSMGQKQAEVPELTGQNGRVAAAQLRELGFVVQQTATDTAEEAPEPGTVLATDPPAGTLLRVGSTVTLTVAAPQTQGYSAVPDLVGKTREEAVFVLLVSGFSVGTVSCRASSGQSGTVLSQSPPAGSPMPQKSAVSFTVSAPQEPFD